MRRIKKLSLLAGTSMAAAGLLALSGPLYAQTAAPDGSVKPDADDTVVVVKGQRGSAISAVNRKKNADELVDSIVAVDIGKLPDLNVAEALQRISGVQITRNRGEGSSIAIRGLTQVRTELNGRDSFSTTDGRALSFEDVPAELLGGVDVYKNPSAKQIEGAIGGLVNLRTRMPFDSKGMLLSGSVSSTYYDARKDWGSGASALYSNRWSAAGGGELGLLINLSYNKAVFREDSITIEPFYDRTDIPGENGAKRAVASGGGISTWNGDRTRTGEYVAAQYRPNDAWEFYATFLNSNYKFYDPQTGIFGYGAGEGGSLTPIPGSYKFDSAGNLQKGGFVSPSAQTFTRDAIRDSRTTDFSAGGKWRVSDKLRVSVDAQRITSESTYDDVTGFGSYQNPYNFYLDLTGDVPDLHAETPPTNTVQGPYYSTPQNYFYQALMVRTATNVGDETAVRADLEWDFDEGSVFKSFTAGIRATSKNVETRDSGFDWSGISGPPWDGADLSQADYVEFPQYALLDPYQSSFWRGDQATADFGPHYVIDPALLKDHTKALQVLGGLNPNSGAPSAPTPQDQINTQGEKTTAAYAQLSFDVQSAPLPFDGNFGIRVVQTKVSADGVQTLKYRTTPTGADIDATSPISVDQDYTEVLPSLNLRFFVKDNLFWRVAASRGLSRPSFGQMAANFTITENYIGTPPVFRDRTGSGGNPGLRPLTANQFDTSLEWYYKSGSMLYGTLFYKDVKDFVQNGVYDYQFAVPGKGLQTFLVSAPVNGEKGTIKGAEIGVQHFFTELPGLWNGLGIQANYTYVDSKAPSPSATDTNGNPLIVPLEGLSKDSYNIVGMYEHGPLSVRLAYNWRSSWVVTTAGNGTGNLPIYHDATGQLDGTIAYDFNSRIGISLDMVNILNTVQKTYQAYPNRPRDFVIDDRRIGLRLRGTF